MSTGMALWKLPCQRKQVLDGCGTSLSRESKLNTDTRDHRSQGCRDQTGKCVLPGNQRRLSEALFHVWIHSTVICWLSALYRVQRMTQAWLNQRACIAHLWGHLRFLKAFPCRLSKSNSTVCRKKKLTNLKRFSKIARNRGWEKWFGKLPFQCEFRFPEPT